MPPLDTVIVEPVAPVLHSKLPPAFVDKVEVPLQLFVTVTTGIVGVGFTVTVAVPVIVLGQLGVPWY